MPKKLQLGTYRKRRKEAESTSCVVSLPLAIFTGATLCSIERLDQRLKTLGGPPSGTCIYVFYMFFYYLLLHYLKLGWTQTLTGNALHFTKMDFSRPIPQLLFCLSIVGAMSWTLSSSGVELTCGSLVDSIPNVLASVAAVLSLLSRLDKCCICEGNGKFGELLLQPRFLRNSGMFVHLW